MLSQGRLGIIVNIPVCNTKEYIPKLKDSVVSVMTCSNDSLPGNIRVMHPMITSFGLIDVDDVIDSRYYNLPF